MFVIDIASCNEDRGLGRLDHCQKHRRLEEDTQRHMRVCRVKAEESAAIYISRDHNHECSRTDESRISNSKKHSSAHESQGLAPERLSKLSHRIKVLFGIANTRTAPWGVQSLVDVLVET